jgi:hypothetical protein
MSISHYYTIDNGGIDWTIAVWNCDECGSKIDDSWPKVARKTCHFCMPCAFKLGEITEDGYYGGRRFPDQHVEVFEGEVWEWVGKKSPFNRTATDCRKTKDYKDWRASVFSRDKFKCLSCGQVGGNLEAHHIKKFNDFPKLRYEISNGETLCLQCHRARHRRSCNG